MGASAQEAARGPLAGLRVLEFEAIGPAPFCGMLLADMGADVLLVDRLAPSGLGLERSRGGQERTSALQERTSALQEPTRAFDVMLRGRRSIALDLKSSGGAEAARLLADRADALIEGFRPGVMERLGLGPEPLLARNPRLVYGRMTGWGQDGPLAPRAGHDIDYIALSGVLHAIGRAGGPPVPPLNLVGDFGGGGMLLAFGLCAALLHAQRTGAGQVVDAAMFEGASLLATMFAGLSAQGHWNPARRGANALDSGAPWYDVYETRDGRFMAVGAIEPRFYAALLEGLGLGGEALPAQHDRENWPVLRDRIAAVFRTRPRDEWSAVFAGTDACVTPVLDFAEARSHPHARARKSFVESAGIPQPAPAPRFSRTPGAVRRAPPERGDGGRAALTDWGCTAVEIAHIESLGAVLDEIPRTVNGNR